MKPLERTRRELLREARGLAALGLLPLLPAVAGGRGARRRRERRGLLVVLFLRGGIDGLNLVVPHGEAAYYRLRPTIAIPRPGARDGAVDLDGFFGLHPRAASLAPHFAAGRAACLTGVGHARNSRSHFEEQDLWETGVEGAGVGAPGWLNRYLADVGGDGPVRAVALANSLPRLLRGEQRVLAVRGLADLAGDAPGERADALRRAVGGDGPHESWAQEARATLEMLRELRATRAHEIPAKVEYPRGDLPRRLRELAGLIRADVGLEVAALDVPGWDTHQNQGGASGPYAQRVAELADGVDAFLRDLADERDDVLVLALSEFGRTAFENGTGGTDHGWGNHLLAFGPPLAAAGREAPVIGTWPGLERDRLHAHRDLALTRDFRDVLGEVVGRHLGHPAPAELFPGRELEPVGLL